MKDDQREIDEAIEERDLPRAVKKAAFRIWERKPRGRDHGPADLVTDGPVDQDAEAQPARQGLLGGGVTLLWGESLARRRVDGGAVAGFSPAN